MTVPLPEPDMSYVIDGPAKYNAQQMREYSDAENAGLQTTLADSRAYVERLKGRIDEVKAELATLRAVVEGAAAADEFLENPEAIYRLARIARAALGATK